MRKIAVVTAFMAAMAFAPLAGAQSYSTIPPAGVTKPASWYKEAWLWWYKDPMARSYSVYVYDWRRDQWGHGYWHPVTGVSNINPETPWTGIRYLMPKTKYKWQVQVLKTDGTSTWWPMWDLKPMNANGVKVTWAAQKGY